jgi:sulfatase modifying factor 1
VPLGPDPDSGLEEFGHPLTGSVPGRDDGERLVVSEETGLVFVLLPRGTFWMGAQPLDPKAHNYDPDALGDQRPVHEVDLSAFFLSKYEMTQGQWARFTGRNPSRDRPETHVRSWNRDARAGSLLHPVEQVSWWDCVEVCERMGLSLPSEAQWEYGARSGTTSVWWTGDERESLRGAANLADRYARDNGAGSGWVIEEWLDDGNTSHAPVTVYAPNAFGLHNVHGNVWEWCLDAYESGFYGRTSRRDPLNEPSGSSGRVNRGGSFANAAVGARSAGRLDRTPEVAHANLGLRPARALRAP